MGDILPAEKAAIEADARRRFNDNIVAPPGLAGYIPEEMRIATSEFPDYTVAVGPNQEPITATNINPLPTAKPKQPTATPTALTKGL